MPNAKYFFYYVKQGEQALEYKRSTRLFFNSLKTTITESTACHKSDDNMDLGKESICVHSIWLRAWN